MERIVYAVDVNEDEDEKSRMEIQKGYKRKHECWNKK